MSSLGYNPYKLELYHCSLPIFEGFSSSGFSLVTSHLTGGKSIGAVRLKDYPFGLVENIPLNTCPCMVLVIPIAKNQAQTEQIPCSLELCSSLQFGITCSEVILAKNLWKDQQIYADFDSPAQLLRECSRIWRTLSDLKVPWNCISVFQD